MNVCYHVTVCLYMYMRLIVIIINQITQVKGAFRKLSSKHLDTVSMETEPLQFS